MVTSPDPTPLPGLDDPAAVEEPPRGRSRVECRVCGEELTAADSRLWGVGRQCRHKLGLHGGRRPRRFDVDQDGLPGL